MRERVTRAKVCDCDGRACAFFWSGTAFSRCTEVVEVGLMVLSVRGAGSGAAATGRKERPTFERKRFTGIVVLAEVEFEKTNRWPNCSVSSSCCSPCFTSTYRIRA